MTNKLPANVDHVFWISFIRGPSFPGKQMAGAFQADAEGMAQGWPQHLPRNPLCLPQTLPSSKVFTQSHHPTFTYLGQASKKRESKIFNFLIKGVVEETAITV